MLVEKALNNLKGTVIDYNMDCKQTLYALVKSEAGNYSIRQNFINAQGEYKSWYIVNLFGKISNDLAKLYFMDFMDKIYNH